MSSVPSVWKINTFQREIASSAGDVFTEIFHIFDLEGTSTKYDFENTELNKLVEEDFCAISSKSFKTSMLWWITNIFSRSTILKVTILFQMFSYQTKVTVQIIPTHGSLYDVPSLEHIHYWNQIICTLAVNWYNYTRTRSLNLLHYNWIT